jgi:putative endonuclease
MYWVYILNCNNGSYYTGYTDDLVKRYRSHLNATGGCKYTRSYKPVGIAQCWIVSGEKALAMKVEREIKKLSKEKKRQLILNPSQLLADFQVTLVTKQEKQQLEDQALL